VPDDLGEKRVVAQGWAAGHTGKVVPGEGKQGLVQLTQVTVAERESGGALDRAASEQTWLTVIIDEHGVVRRSREFRSLP
jgi:hypothetical protein